MRAHLLTHLIQNARSSSDVQRPQTSKDSTPAGVLRL